MTRFDDFPYGPLREALETVLGRVGLLFAVVLGGAALGCVTAAESWRDAWEVLTDLPGLILMSLFYGKGLFVLPAALVFGILSVRLEWRLRYHLIFLVLMAWNLHQTVRWSAYDGPQAQKLRKVQEELRESIRLREKAAQ